MAASTTPLKRRVRGYRGPRKVVQPPTAIVGLDGNELLLTGMDPDSAGYRMRIRQWDMDVWDIERVAAEADVTMGTAYGWNANRSVPEGATTRGIVLPDPDGYVSDRPWWRAARIRSALIDAGRMTESGVAVHPATSPGRPVGAKDRAPRITTGSRRTPAQLAAAVKDFDEYRKLIDAGLPDEAARRRLARRWQLSRETVSTRIDVGREAADMPTVTAQWVRIRCEEITAKLAGGPHRGRALHNAVRDALVQETYLSRRQIARLLKQASR